MKSEVIPKFQSKEEYGTYRMKISIWEDMTDIDEEKRAGTLMMHLTGRPLEVALTCDRAKLKEKKTGNTVGNVGVALLLEKFDEVYYSKDALLEKYEKFNSMKRGTENMAEFIQSYERKVNDLDGDGLKIPELIKAYELLLKANLSTGDEKLVRATCKTMTFDEVKQSLMRLNDAYLPSYASSSPKVKEVPIKIIKREPEDRVDEAPGVMYNNYYKRPNNNNQSNNKPPRECYCCGSLDHWIAFCPHMKNFPYHPNHNGTGYHGGNHEHYQQRPMYNQQQGHYQTHFVPEAQEEIKATVGVSEGISRPILYGIGEVEEENQVDSYLTDETLNHAVIDSGASETVCGKKWFSTYLDSISFEELNQVKQDSSDMLLTFGSDRMKASKKLTLPVNIANQNIMLNDVQLVDQDVPLLLSMKSIRSLGMMIDGVNDSVRIGNVACKVNTLKSGQYSIPVVPPKPVRPPSPIMFTENVGHMIQGRMLF